MKTDEIQILHNLKDLLLMKDSEAFAIGRMIVRDLEENGLVLGLLARKNRQTRVLLIPAADLEQGKPIELSFAAAEALEGCGGAA